MRHVTSYRCQRLAVGGLVGLGTFQACLAAGAPWGAASYGGTHRGVLPARLRLASGLAVPLYGGLAIWVGTQTGSVAARRQAFAAVSALLAVGSVANLASPSLLERALWAPVTSATAWCLWHSRPSRPGVRVG